jgi:hypothetical protein
MANETTTPTRISNRNRTPNRYLSSGDYLIPGMIMKSSENENNVSITKSEKFKQDHPNYFSESSKQFRENHPNASAESSRQYRDLHPNSSSISSQEYRKANPKSSADNSKEYRRKKEVLSASNPSNHVNHNFERDAFSALRNLAELNGVKRDILSALSDDINLADPVTRARLSKTMTDQVMGKDKLQTVLTGAIKTYHPRMPICSCAVCGFMDLDAMKDEFVRFHLTDEIADRLKVDQSLLDHWNEKQRKASMVPPIVLGPADPLNPPPTVSALEIVKAAFNYVELPKNSNSWYHLHRSLLFKFDDSCPRNEIEFLACPSCASSLGSKIRPDNGEFNAPRFSLKSGMDVGNLTALLDLGMPPLSTPELQVLSPTRIMSVILKLVTDGNSSGEGQWAIKGHSVCFPHKSFETLESAGVFPNWSAVQTEFSYVFIGKKDEWKRIRDGNNLHQSHVFRVHVWRLLAWARALSHINDLPAFRNIEPEFDAETIARLEALPDQLIDSVSILDNDITIGIDLKKSSDVAQVRNKEAEPDMEESASSSASDEKHTPHFSSDSVLLDGVMLQSSGEIHKSHAFTGVCRAVSSIIDTISGTAGNAGNTIRPSSKKLRTNVRVSNVANVPGSIAGSVCAVDTASADSTMSDNEIDLPAAEEAPKTHIIRRGSEPFSEFGENHILLTSSFPLLFLLKNVIPSTGGMSKAFVRFLMHQFDSRFARNHHFVFLAYNQRSRHENIRSVTARVKSGHENVTKFQDLMAQPSIVADLKFASENPKTDESRKLMAKIMPVIKLAGQKTDWGPIARAACVSKITAMV